MIQAILSITAVILAVSYPLYSVAKRDRSPANFALLASLLAAAALEFFDLMTLTRSGDLYIWKKCSLVAESVFPFSWLLFSLFYARQGGFRALATVQRLLLAVAAGLVAAPLLVPVRSFFYSPDFSGERVLFLGNPGFAFYLVLLAYLIVAIVNLEVTLASAARDARWKIKFEILGSGSLLAALIFYYSEVLLYRTINMNLLPVRSTALLTAVVLIAFSQLRRQDGVRISISRNLMYKSLVLFFIGIYLIGLGLVGEGMKYFGESFQRSIAMAVAFVAGIGVIAMILSESVKRSVRVFIVRNFYQSKYDYRNQWEQFADRLSSAKSGDELLTGILSHYCETFGMGCGTLFTGDDEQKGYAMAARLEMAAVEAVVGAGDPLVRFMSEKRWVVNTREENPHPDPEMRMLLEASDAALIIPLFHNDELNGFIVLGRPLSRNEIHNFEDYDLMKTLAHQTSSAILNLRLAEQLARAKEMEVLGRISAFMIHDLKNLVYTVSLMVENAREYIAEPEFQQDMLASLGNTVAKMKALIAKLKYLPEKEILQKVSFDLLELAKETAAMIAGAEISVSGRSLSVDADREEMQKVMLNLLVNAVDASDGAAAVAIEVGADTEPFFRVRDRGCGIPEEFLRRHLFSPFRTTKKTGLGIGLYQCRQIVAGHGGRIEIESVVGKGTVCTVWLPSGRPGNGGEC